MRVYIASSFNLTDTVDVVARYLEARGHTIAVKWWAADGFNMHDKKKDPKEDFYADVVCKMIYDRDFAGILGSDVFVIVAGTTPKAFNGANVEYGIALASGKRCFSIGRLARSAMYYPIIQCRALSELAEKIEEGFP